MKDNKKLKEDIKKENKKFWDDFKTFISRGNVVDMAVGVIIGSAFSKIVTSIVDDIIMPLVGIVIGGIDFSQLSFTIKNATVNYGNFIQSVVDFLIVAFCIFLFIKLFERLKKAKPAVEEPKKEDEQIILLREIRDSLKMK